MRPLIVTSINPRDRFDLQRSCFETWRDLGFDVLTYNVEREAAQLVQSGIEPANIVRVAPEQTGIALHKTPAPLINSVLDDLASRENIDSVLLVNSDIFPAMRSSETLFSLLAPCAAFTRNEIVSLTLNSNLPPRQYRGGLDAFFFSMDAFWTLRKVVQDDKASNRMAFGVPGWDYYLGAHVISPELGGKILDATFLLHVTHPVTYSNIGEFAHYVEPLARLGAVSSTDTDIAVREFAKLIQVQCVANANFAKALTSMYQRHEKRAARKSGDMDGNVFARLRILNDLLAPSQRIDAGAVARLAREQEISYSVLKPFFNAHHDGANRFTVDLRAFHAYLTLFFGERGQSLTGIYPKNSLHGKAVDGILQTADPEETRRRVLELFANELLNHRILNKRILAYLCLCCGNDEERFLLTRICKFLRNATNEKTH